MYCIHCGQEHPEGALYCSKTGKKIGGGVFQIDEMANGHKYVDLGLTSGTLWASSNLGADSPEDPGDYFTWGGHEGYEEGHRCFDEEHYRYYFSSGGVMHYCTNESEGDVDNLVELDWASDDHAQRLWKGNWRTPSLSQLKELLRETDSEWRKDRGGRLFISKKNGKSIFLPFGGHMHGSLYSGGPSVYPPSNFSEEGMYWSRTLDKGHNHCAHDLVIIPNEKNYPIVTIESIGRFCGLCIRPVLSMTEKKPW